ncbi:MAG: S-methyl-5'-thioadenosine phosphorylase [Bradymonadia bacterium]
MSDLVVGVIGGSGLYEIEGIENVEEITLQTPYGDPSDAYIRGTLDGVEVVFLARHGRGHRISPSELNFRANIWGFKKLGVRHLISVSAVGSLQEEIVPGHLVCVDQFIDRTTDRPRTFFEGGIVGHVQFADPVSPELQAVLFEAATAQGATVHNGGTYVCIEGPTFSTRAESHLFRQWGANVVGMTNVPECRLAREAEIAYATLALATDYDCWYEGHDDVSVEAVIAIIKQNVATAKQVIRKAVVKLAEVGHETWPAHEALGGGMAVMTSPDLIPAETRARVDLLVGRYLWPEGPVNSDSEASSAGEEQS